MPPTIRPRMVHRLYLINRINEKINQRFVLVSAPPGYGKTTLLADWARNCPTPVAWLTLDEQDNDLKTINRYLEYFLETFFHTLRKNLSDILPVGNDEAYFHYLLVTLINECIEADTDFTLVLDDYQVIDNPQIHEGILFLLEHFPIHLRLLIATRSDPPFSLARFRANDQVLELRTTDLKFTTEETKEFFIRINQMDLSESEILLYCQQTEGWITGLQLAAIAKENPKSSFLAGSTTPGNTNLTLDYMIEEVFYHQTSQIQDFLLRTSILDNLSGHLCDYLLDNHETELNCQELLHTLYHANLFLIALDNDEHWFRYHPLFAEALQHLLKEKLPAQIFPLKIRASEWCDQNGLYEEALSYAYDCDDLSRFIVLLQKYVLTAIKCGNILDFSRWITKISDELMATNPLLCLLYSCDLMASLALDASEIWLNKARDLIANENALAVPDSDDLKGMIYAVQSMLAVVRGNIEQAIALSEKAINLLPEESGFSRVFLLLDQAISFSLNGELDKAVDVLYETIHLSEISGNWFVMMLAHINLAALLIDKGQLSQSMVLLQQSLSFMFAVHGNCTALEGLMYKEMGEICLARNQLTKASQYLYQGIEAAKNWLPSISDLDTHVRLAHLLHCQGDFAGSKREIAIARHISDLSQGQLDDIIVDVVEVKLQLLRGQTKLAQKWLQKHGLLEKDIPQNILGRPLAIAIPVMMALARFYIVDGKQGNEQEKCRRAVAVLNSLMPVLIKAGFIEYQIEAYVLLSLAYHKLERPDDMIMTMTKAFILAEPEEYRQIFLDEGVPMARLLTHYLAYLKKCKNIDGLPTREYLSDLLFHLNSNEATDDEDECSPEGLVNADPQNGKLLTAREINVLQQVAKGRTNKEIAQDLHLSINTIKRHLNNIFLKLGVTTRTQALTVARSHNLIL